MNHVVMYSGGACSWAAAMRVKDRHPGENVILLFADTKMEDEDLYRFLDDSEQQLGVMIVRIADGRTPWQIFKDERFLGNSRADPCSKILKRELMTRWERDHFSPNDTILHFGLDWTEMHRLERLRLLKAPWRVEGYMTEAPYLNKREMLAWMKREGLRPPRLYDLGFVHNNCGGFCVKSGQAHFANLLKQLPQRYALHEQKEQEMRDYLGKDYTIMKHGKTLRDFRLQIESKIPHDEFDFGGCGCAVD